MLFIEYTKYDTKKAINVAMCHTIEVQKSQTSSRSAFSIKLTYPGGSDFIDFKTEEQLNKAFDSLMKAIQDSDTRKWTLLTFDHQ